MSTNPVLLWDFDGTLADTLPLWRAGILGVVTDRGGFIDEGTLRAALHSSSSGIVQILTRVLGTPIAGRDLLHDLWSRVQAQLQLAIPWQPGARRLLVEAQSAQIRCGLVSNAPRILLETALGSLSSNLFECVVGSEDVTAAKPAPDPYLQALADLRVGPQDAVAIEDSATGVQAALAAGVPVVHVGDAPVNLPTVGEVTSLTAVTVAELISFQRREARRS
ncbi:MAG: HAD family hydrolase [Propioniciclava sp.]